MGCVRIEDIPNFRVTSAMFEKIATINGLIKQTDEFKDKKVELRLRKESKIRSINSSLAIEGNDLGFLTVRDVIDGKDVEGDYIDIVEVKNAVRAYGMIASADPWSIDDLLSIHSEMMFGLVEYEGFRKHGVGVYEGADRLVYKAPDPEDVPAMVGRLFEWGHNSELPAPITAAIVHYYIEAIHPFEDGNGRMGRLWHTLLMRRYGRIFDLIPLESKIRSRQSEYYEALERCQGGDPQDCTGFIEFCLDVTISSLEDLLHLKDPRMDRLLKAMGDEPMSALDIMRSMGLSDRNHFKDMYLQPAMGYGFVAMTEADKPSSPNQKYRKTII